MRLRWLSRCLGSAEPLATSQKSDAGQKKQHACNLPKTVAGDPFCSSFLHCQPWTRGPRGLRLYVGDSMHPRGRAQHESGLMGGNCDRCPRYTIASDKRPVVGSGQGHGSTSYWNQWFTPDDQIACKHVECRAQNYPPGSYRNEVEGTADLAVR